MASNGKAGHAPRNEARRTSFGHAAGYSARNSAAPSLSSARREPPSTRQSIPARPQMRSAIYSSRTSEINYPSKRTHRPAALSKKVRFERIDPGTPTLVSIQPLPPTTREQAAVFDVRHDIPPPVNVPAVKPHPKSSLVAIIWRGVRRLLAGECFLHSNPRRYNST